MDEIIIEKLKLSGKHGCFAAERDESRDFEVSMRLFLNLGPAAKTDDLSMTIDYPAAMAIAEGGVVGRKRKTNRKARRHDSGKAFYKVCKPCRSGN